MSLKFLMPRLGFFSISLRKRMGKNVPGGDRAILFDLQGKVNEGRIAYSNPFEPLSARIPVSIFFS
jgi:hypothetical protein